MTRSQEISAQILATARREANDAKWQMIRRVNRRARGVKLIERCYTHLYGTRHPEHIRRADLYAVSSGADQAGSRMRFQEARANGLTLVKQVMHDITAGTENYMLCGGAK